MISSRSVFRGGEGHCAMVPLLLTLPFTEKEQINGAK